MKTKTEIEKQKKEKAAADKLIGEIQKGLDYVECEVKQSDTSTTVTATWNFAGNSAEINIEIKSNPKEISVGSPNVNVSEDDFSTVHSDVYQKLKPIVQAWSKENRYSCILFRLQ